MHTGQMWGRREQGGLRGRFARYAGALAAAVALAGCSGAGAAASQVTSAPPATTQARPTKLLVVVLENHAPDSVEQEMPQLSAQGRRYGTATAYYALTHPSLGNYLAIAGGTTFGVRDDDPPKRHRLSGRSVFGQGAAGRTRTYAEGMTEPCEQHDDGDYAVRHNPWTYFADERTACQRDDLPSGTPSAGALQRDLAAGRMPTFAMLIPDLCNDAHDCELATSDRWLSPWLQAVQAGPDWKAGRLAVLVTFDEDDHTAGNRITAVLMHPSLHGVKVDRRLDHRDLSASASRLLGGQPLREAAGRPGLLEAFGLA